jgi:hypothetical protein
MKLFKTETPKFDEGYHRNMEKNGVIKTFINHINPLEISSINEYKGKLLHSGWDCSQIVMKNGNRFIDYRKVAQLLKELKTV